MKAIGYRKSLSVTGPESLLDVEPGRIDAATLRKARGVIEAGTARGRIALEGF
ncbi:hypothetical protein [Azospirillum picis]|uniref:Uncharacterized protein n=1 Tax=Azospirillum picis TaxID=488438 RepID=A0ABU0MPS4_9PROT|nr:hypothetical protein [Azospirillum picis]MBP2301695.1 hypothetical protein [Azospirillum picis]MDQ0535481.1 hypothetical protein [Azospirillum picis]